MMRKIELGFLPLLLLALFLLARPLTAEAQLYATDFNNEAVDIFTTGGGNSVFANISGNPTGITENSQGDLYVGIYGSSGAIFEVTPTGQVSTFASSAITGGGGLVGPNNLVYYNGTVYAQGASGTDDNVYAFNSSGQQSIYVSATSPVEAIAFSSTGVLFAALTNNTIVEFNSGVQSLFANDASINSPNAMVFYSGSLYVADYNSGEVEKYNVSTGLGTVFTQGSALASSGIDGIAFNSSGDLFVASDSNFIEEYSPTGADMGVFSTVGGADFAGLTFVSTPEPSTWALLAMATACLFLGTGLRRKMALARC